MKTYYRQIKQQRTLKSKLGIQKGWTAIPDFTIEQRIELIKKHHPMPNIDWIFEKYLYTNRFGETVDQ